eukprot:NODE_16659_length_984_cov_3.246208.p2 GENE.NODE_16659_length_984_cov_3.246208~~NODE_16659_length_984_cov_3.246208.p2  ORF type:complete len:115 (-),score=33.05 NODE_16659_length_984_cov_3.246208:368-712(-)
MWWNFGCGGGCASVGGVRGGGIKLLPKTGELRRCTNRESLRAGSTGLVTQTEALPRMHWHALAACSLVAQAAAVAVPVAAAVAAAAAAAVAAAAASVATTHWVIAGSGGSEGGV